MVFTLRHRRHAGGRLPKDRSLARFVCPPAFVHVTIVICVSRDCMTTTYTGPPTVVIKILRDKRLFSGHTFVTQTTESPAILPFQPEQDGLLTEGLLKSCFLLFRNICIGHSRLYIENSNLNMHYRMQRVNCQVS